MLDLYIIGAGDVGGFVAHHIDDFGSYNIKGFLDDDEKKHGEIFYGLPVLGAVNKLIDIKENVAVAVAIASSRVKKIIVEKLKVNPNLSFPNFVHSSVWLGGKVELGKGCIIYPGVTVNFEAEIHSFVTINMNATIGHNCELKNYSTLSPGVNCGGFTEVGECSFLGIGSSTLQSTKIGEHVTVGAGAVIIRDVPDNAVVVGNPGKIIKYNQ